VVAPFAFRVSNGGVCNRIGGSGDSNSGVGRRILMKTRMSTILLTVFLAIAIHTTFGAQLTTHAVQQVSGPGLLASNSWGSGQPMPTSRQGAAIGLIKAKVYVVSGATDNAVTGVTEIYDPARNTWTVGASIPTPRFVPASAVVNGILYVIGGDSGSGVLNVVEAYDPVHNTWSTKAPMPTARNSVKAVAKNNIIYVMGGYSPNGGRLATVEAFDPATNTWSAKAPMKVGKSMPSVGVLGSILAIGGLTNANIVTTDNEGYSTTSNSWKALAPMLTARQASCEAAISGKFYVASGHGALFGDILSVHEAYSGSTKTWTSLAPIPQSTANPGAVAVGGRLYCFGGSDDGRIFQGHVLNNVQIYQP
jgi:N-acetylneuraminic acid mutarotase